MRLIAEVERIAPSLAALVQRFSAASDGRERRDGVRAIADFTIQARGFSRARSGT